jgi:DNA-binding MarR family transcriptional regulator
LRASGASEKYLIISHLKGLHFATVACYNADGVIYLAEDYKQLREYTRLLVRCFSLEEDNAQSCCDITLTQCHALVEIGRAGYVSLKGLAYIMGLDKSTMSRTVDNLVKAGYVSRETDPNNRCCVMITLTDKGKAEFDEIESSMDDYFKRLYDQLPPESGPKVLESLRLLLKAIGTLEE